MKIKKTPTTGLILHFRTPEKTLKCLESLLSEGITNAILVDNSEDNGKSINSMELELKKLKENGITTKIISKNINLGFANGVNYGLKHISENLQSNTLLINSDAELTPGSLGHMLELLEADKVITPQIIQNNKPTSSHIYYDKTLALVSKKPITTPLKFISGCCMLIHKKNTSKTFFDNSFFFYGEDVVMSQKCQESKIALIECPKAIVIHAGSSSAKNGSFFYEYHINRAHWLLAKKLANSRPQYLVMLGARCLTLPLRALIRSARFASLTPCKGLAVATFDALRGRWRSFTPPP